jgi:lycopene elongase/hydratase (flavuxanthin-forming)
VNTIRRLLVSSRPISWINTAYPFAATYFFLGGELDPGFWITTFFFLVPYNLLMYGINDVFDYESDLRNPRKGGVEGGLLPPELHSTTLKVVAVTSLPFVAFISWQSMPNFVALAVFLLTIFFVVAYSIKGLRYKEIPFLDSITSSIHFIGPMLFAVTLIGQLSSVLVVAMLAFFLWGAASHAFGAVQDIRADREAGIASIATALGARRTIRLAFALYVVAGSLLLLLPDRFAFASLAALPYLFVIAKSFSVSDENCEAANKGWRWFLALNFLAGAIVTSLLIGPM